MRARRDRPDEASTMLPIDSCGAEHRVLQRAAACCNAVRHTERALVQSRGGRQRHAASALQARDRSGSVWRTRGWAVAESSARRRERSEAAGGSERASETWLDIRAKRRASSCSFSLSRSNASYRPCTPRWAQRTAAESRRCLHALLLRAQYAAPPAAQCTVHWDWDAVDLQVGDLGREQQVQPLLARVLRVAQRVRVVDHLVDVRARGRPPKRDATGTHPRRSYSARTPPVACQVSCRASSRSPTCGTKQHKTTLRGGRCAVGARVLYCANGCVGADSVRSSGARRPMCSHFAGGRAAYLQSGAAGGGT